VTHGTPGAQAAKGATATIPIVMAVVGNPVETGLVGSIVRPGGNITGVALFFPELNAKRVELLKEAVPRIARVGALLNLDNPAHAAVLSAMEETARALRLELHRAGIRRPEELDGVIVQLKGRIDGLSVIDDAMLIANAPGHRRRRGAPSAAGDRLQGVRGSGRPDGLRRQLPPDLAPLDGVWWTRSSRAPDPATCPSSRRRSSS
jgi:hypothetical protein